MEAPGRNFSLRCWCCLVGIVAFVAVLTRCDCDERLFLCLFASSCRMFLGGVGGVGGGGGAVIDLYIPRLLFLLFLDNIDDNPSFFDLAFFRNMERLALELALIEKAADDCSISIASSNDSSICSICPMKAEET